MNETYKYSLEERTYTLEEGCHGNGGKIIEITTKENIVLSEVTVYKHSVSKYGIVNSCAISLFWMARYSFLLISNLYFLNDILHQTRA